MQRTLNLKYDEVIIGADLDALHFSYANNIPIIFTRIIKHPEFTIDNKTQDVSQEKIMFLLGLKSLVPFSDKISNISIEENNILNVTLKSGFSSTIEYKKIYLSDDYKVSGLPLNRQENTYLVLDYIDVISGHNHNHEEIIVKKSFVKKIKFFTSKRFRFKQTKNKDCVLLSLLTERQLEQDGCSDIAARFIASRTMQKSGITGRWDKTNKSFKKVKLRSNKREIFQINKPCYEQLPSNIVVLETQIPVMLEEENIWHQ